MMLLAELNRHPYTFMRVALWTLTMLALIACSDSNDQGDPDTTTVDVTMDSAVERDTHTTSDVSTRADMSVDVIDDTNADSTDTQGSDTVVDMLDATADQEADSLPDLVDPPVVTYTQDVQPILMTSCRECHSDQGMNPSSLRPFVDSYAEIQRPSDLCPGESVGTCIGLAVAEQEMEGTRCRTYVQPFHREGWVCLTEAERTLIADWVRGGLAE